MAYVNTGAEIKKKVLFKVEGPQGDKKLINADSLDALLSSAKAKFQLPDVEYKVSFME